MSEPILTIRDLSVSYGAIAAVKGISFEVRAGEIVSLIGSNGAGKTTTLSAISGLIACRGEILLRGQNVSGIAPHDLVTHGLVHSPEGRGIFSNLTVSENLKLGAYRRRDRRGYRADLDHCFELFPRLKERFRAVAGTLSGGEQQMLSISRALLAKPTILMLDEPSLGLAPLVVQHIFRILERLNKEGMTILLVEQNARSALKLSHRAYVLETGRITVSGEGRTLLADPKIQASYLGH